MINDRSGISKCRAVEHSDWPAVIIILINFINMINAFAGKAEKQVAEYKAIAK